MGNVSHPTAETIQTLVRLVRIFNPSFEGGLCETEGGQLYLTIDDVEGGWVLMIERTPDDTGWVMITNIPGLDDNLKHEDFGQLVSMTLLRVYRMITQWSLAAEELIYGTLSKEGLPDMVL